MPAAVDPDTATLTSLLNSLPNNGHGVESIDRLTAWLPDHKGEYVVCLGPNLPLAEAVALCERLRISRPTVSVILVRHAMATNELMEAMKAGARDVVPYDDPSALTDAVRRAHELYVALRGPTGAVQVGKIVTVFSPKGGVGKTTSTVNVAAALAQLGQRVLVIDLDPQGNASTALSVDHRRGTPSTYDALVDAVPLAEIAVPCEEIPNLFVVPATIDLAGAEIELVSVVARETRLHKAIQAHPWVGTEEEVGADRFDYVLIDCPPSLGLLTLNALVAGAEMMIPIQAEYYALEGLGQLLETVEMVRAHLNPRLAVSTILVTMYDGRTRLASGVADEVREHFGDAVVKTNIPRSVRVSEAPSYGQTVMTYDPGSPGALCYLEAAREIASKGAPA